MAVAATDLTYQLLGPLQVELDGRPVPIQGKKPRTLLALLLVHVNETVSRDTLIDELWPHSPPETAANTIQVYVSQLRRALGPDTVRREANGYMLSANADAVDLHRFEQLVDEAHRPALAPDAVVHLLDEALDLWRGEPLPELPAEAARLSELRLQAVGRRIDAELQLARHEDVLAELEALTRTEPYREQFTAQLMVALYRSSRQAEALAAYQRLRTTLQDELGLEPTPELRELERAVLNHEVSPAVLPAAAPMPALDELRKPVTVLAASFDRTLELDVEAEASVSARIGAYASTVVAEQEGMVLPTVDGTLVALFGVPYAHEDDAQRATLAAIALERGLPELCAELGPQLAPDLGMRAAVGTTIAVVPAPERGATSVPASVAAATVALARRTPPATILLAPTTFALLKDRVVVEPFVDPREPSAAWRLAGLRTATREARTPFVGRVDQLHALRSAFDVVVSEHVVLERRVTGPAGVGKTRLVDEFARSLGDEASILRSACRSLGGGGGYAALSGIVEAALALTSRSRTAELLGDAEGNREAAQVLDALTGREDQAPGGSDVGDAVARLVRHLAAEAPVVVVIDELEWASEELLETIASVRDRIENGPVLFVTLARSGELDVQDADDAGASLTLEPLASEDARVLSDRLLEEQVELSLRQRVAEVGEGNPLFIEQLAAVVGETGALPAIPPTIHALLAARLERLTPEERHVLQAGAVLGRSFAGDDASAILDDSPRSLRPILVELEQRQLIASAGGDGWTFHHGLLREAAYDSIPKRRRADLHERFARRLSAGSEDLLAFHLEQVWRLRHELGDRDEMLDTVRREAVSALESAGEQAFRRLDLPASRSLFGRAAKLMPHDDPRRGQLLIDLAEAVRGSGQPRDALAVLDEIETLPHVDPLVEAQAHLARVRIRHVLDSTAPTAQALEQLDAAMRLFEEAGDHARLADSLFLRAWFDWLRCLAGRADEALDRAIELARKARDRRVEGNAVHFKVGVVLFGPHPVSEGIAFCEDLLDLYADEPRIVASASRGLAGLLAMEGRFAEAHEQIARDQEIVERLGMTIEAAGATELYAFVHQLEDDLPAAEAQLRAGCARFEEMGERNSLSTLYASLAQVRWSRGDVEEALELASRGADYALADDLHTQVQARGPKAKALAALGRHDEAQKIAKEAVRLGEATDFLAMRALAALDLAEVLRLGGNEPEAFASADHALGFYDLKGFLVGSEAARRFIDRGAEPPAGTASRPAAQTPQSPP